MNSIMKYAMERAKKHQAAKSSSKPQAVKDENGVDLSVLTKGGITQYKKWDVYVHLADVETILPKGKWHIRDAVGNRVYVKTLKREIAQEFVNLYYGKGRYVVSSSCVD